jgi:hypothetical protein
MPRERQVVVDFLSVAPLFAVEDVAATAAWYEEHLAFKVEAAPAEPPHTEAVLWRDDARIMLVAAPGPLVASGGAVVTIKGILPFYDALRTKVEVTRPIERTAEGNLEFEILDPNGYRLVFTELAEAA